MATVRRESVYSQHLSLLQAGNASLHTAKPVSKDPLWRRGACVLRPRGQKENGNPQDQLSQHARAKRVVFQRALSSGTKVRALSDDCVEDNAEKGETNYAKNSSFRMQVRGRGSSILFPSKHTSEVHEYKSERERQGRAASRGWKTKRHLGTHRGRSKSARTRFSPFYLRYKTPKIWIQTRSAELLRSEKKHPNSVQGQHWPALPYFFETPNPVTAHIIYPKNSRRSGLTISRCPAVQNAAVPRKTPFHAKRRKCILLRG